MLSLCTTLLAVEAPHSFAAFRVATGIQPWKIAQDRLEEPCKEGKEGKHIAILET